MELPVSTPEERAEITRLWHRWCSEADTPLAAEVRAGYAREWSFTPLNGKKPVLLDWQARPRADLETCVRWARAGNVGIRTGQASGVAVLDVDEAKGGRLPCPIPVTPTVETGGGGKHYYYAIPDGIEIRNSVGRIAPHVDVRGDGGQIVFPGSVHPETGAFYEWAEGLSPDDVPLVPFPAHLLELLERAAPVPPPAAPTAYELRSRYLERALRDEVASVATAPEGTRNDTLNRAAFNLGQLVGAGLDESAVVSELLHAAVSAGLPEREARATVASGLGDGKQHPRTVPERSEPPRSAPASTGPVSSAPEPSQAAAWQPCDIGRWFEAAPPPREWVLDKMLAKGDVGLLIAAGGTGKTWLLLELALSLASGVVLLPSLRPVRPSRVLFLSGEDREDILWRRTRHVAGLFTKESMVAQNLRVYAGSSEPLTAMTAQGLQRTQRYAWLRAEVQAFQPDMILLDPKSRWDGGDENDPVCATGFVVALQDLAGEGAAVLLAHHIRKASTGALDSDAARGSTALRDAVRWAATMAPLSDSEAKDLSIENPRQFVKLDVTKSNYAAGLQRPICLQRGEGGMLEETNLVGSRLDSIATYIANWLAKQDNEANLRDLQQRRGEAGKKLGEDLQLKFSKLTKREASQGIKRAIETGLLVTRTGARMEVFVSVPTRA